MFGTRVEAVLNLPLMRRRDFKVRRAPGLGDAVVELETPTGTVTYEPGQAHVTIRELRKICNAAKHRILLTAAPSGCHIPRRA
jgi:hypothetical protein